jgi:hypothetical protein
VIFCQKKTASLEMDSTCGKDLAEKWFYDTCHGAKNAR